MIMFKSLFSVSQKRNNFDNGSLFGDQKSVIPESMFKANIELKKVKVSFTSS